MWLYHTFFSSLAAQIDVENASLLMLHLTLFGLLLGWGAAIPIGAINLEMIRRNLRFGTSAGLMLGTGACCADLTYLILLSLGALQILNNPIVLKITGILGAFILAWFGLMSLRLKAVYIANNPAAPSAAKSTWRHAFEGYLLTLINPYTIVFWSSISMTIAALTHNNPFATLYVGIGVLIATFSWACGLNISLHFTRHRLSKRIIQKINIIGGIILLGFAVFGFWHAFTQ